MQMVGEPGEFSMTAQAQEQQSRPNMESSRPDASKRSAPPDRRTIAFILVTAFLNTMGLMVIIPVLPFLAQRYVSNPNDLATVVGWLTSVYAICQFIAAPALGALSDRYGRRPILLISLFGSAVGYVIFGLGGALWVLFLGRVIDGLTGGNFSTIYAYVADVTEPQDRGKYFGMLGAASGVGFVLGPAIGGLTATFGYQVPLFVAAAITTANIVWGYLYLPESLAKQHRAEKINVLQLNPFGQLRAVFAIPQLQWLLVATFLFSFPFAALTSNLSVFAKDSLRWDAGAVGGLLFVVGVVEIVVQGGLIGRLLPIFGEMKLTIVGLLCQIIGFLLLSLVAGLASALPLFVGSVVFALGDGLVEPSVSGLISRTVGPREQGRVQGGTRAVEALARIFGPVWGGVLYVQLGHASPYWSGAVAVGLAIGAVFLALMPASVSRSKAGSPQPPSS
jgi:MFS transporter, DHA1 family, tetracycline resistance protein